MGLGSEHPAPWPRAGGTGRLCWGDLCPPAWVETLLPRQGAARGKGWDLELTCWWDGGTDAAPGESTCAPAPQLHAQEGALLIWFHTHLPCSRVTPRPPPAARHPPCPAGPWPGGYVAPCVSSRPLLCARFPPESPSLGSACQSAVPALLGCPPLPSCSRCDSSTSCSCAGMSSGSLSPVPPTRPRQE